MYNQSFKFGKIMLQQISDEVVGLGFILASSAVCTTVKESLA